MAKGTHDPFDTLPGGLKLFLRNLHALIPTKLEDHNYHAWSSTVRATLVAHRLLEFVDGTAQPPPPTIVDEKAPAAADGVPVLKPNPAYEQWTILDAQLRAALLATLSPSVQNLVHLCPTAAAIWDHFHQRYNSLSRTHIFQLKEQLHNLRKGELSMQAYLDEALKIVTALSLAREPVPEQDLILNVLCGLPSEYASLKQNVRTNITDLTFNKVSSWLLSEELNVQLEHKLQIGTPSTSNTDVLQLSILIIVEEDHVGVGEDDCPVSGEDASVVMGAEPLLTVTLAEVAAVVSGILYLFVKFVAGLIMERGSVGIVIMKMSMALLNERIINPSTLYPLQTLISIGT
ncbi:unnamed protein product [Cuscuta campestris]|uniref:Uncharacterized protein n=1 Tax=Cuscuta campestris TaxID=132261 RepID=A0A484MS52_9ASTE|nr:unnamed protein product [Cuscuta campestris]